MPRYNLSPECSKGGDGQCDGWFGDHQWCDCECHIREVGRTTDDVRIWHENYWKVA